MDHTYMYTDFTINIRTVHIHAPVPFDTEADVDDDNNQQHVHVSSVLKCPSLFPSPLLLGTFAKPKPHAL